MIRRKSILGLVVSIAYLIGAALIINEFRCPAPADSFLCGRTLGAVIVALPWTYTFLSGDGNYAALIAMSVIGITANAVILYVCGWTVESRWRARKLP